MTQWVSIALNGIVTTFHTIFDPVVAWWNGIWTAISTTASNIWNSISATVLVFGTVSRIQSLAWYKQLLQ